MFNLSKGFWKHREPDDECSFYWPEEHYFDDDYSLVIKVSGGSGGLLYDGVDRIEPSHPDYRFWIWVIEERAYSDLIGSDELADLRKEYLSREAQN